jgi:hypothetical protein
MSNTTNRGPARSARPAPKNASPNHPSRKPPARTLRSRHPVLSALMPVCLVVLIVATMVVIKAAGGPSGAPAASAASASGATALPASVLAAVTSVSPSTLNAVGSPGSVVAPTALGGSPAPLRGADGKPEIVYVGAEYCPYCAAERWAMAVALSRFGTFSHLGATHSSSQDVYPDTQTLSFYGSHYTSPYVDFVPVEEATDQLVDGSYATLQTPTAAESALLAQYDAAGNIPFVDIGNKYVISGASYSPQVLQGLSLAQIAAQLNDPSSPVAQAIDGTANNITAAISAITGDQPTSVSSSPAIAAIAKGLGA